MVAGFGEKNQFIAVKIFLFVKIENLIIIGNNRPIKFRINLISVTLIELLQLFQFKAAAFKAALGGETFGQFIFFGRKTR